MLRTLLSSALLAAAVNACDGCYGPVDTAVHKRITQLDRRMQPDAQPAVTEPRGPLAWGQLNFIHTTDTHGWLEGHLLEQNYGADWGDYASFVKRMREQADEKDVDLLVIDTGDLHDGAGLSDATTPDGSLSNPIFENVDYDLLTIGNHELYLSNIAYETATQFVPYYGDKYISSNVLIHNNATGQYQPIAKQYRYFQTKRGLNIMAFGVLYDFTGNSNASQVIPAKTLIQQPWFLDAVTSNQPIDLFLLIGHNPVRGSSSTLITIQNFIRSKRPDIPIQIFGGHTHIRDFKVYDQGSTGLESGRYCETLGFLSMSGFPARGALRDGPTFGPRPSQAAIPPPAATSSLYSSTKTSQGPGNPTSSPISATTITSSSSSALSTPPPSSGTCPTGPFKNFRFFRRYLDWNRNTFEYHAEGSQTYYPQFDTAQGEAISKNITATRNELNLNMTYGCAPQTWCISCAPFLSQGSIFSLLQTALATTVVNSSRADIPRIIIINTGSVRFDLPQGPFTYDDSFIVSPFHDTFQYISNVPWATAKTVLATLNGGAYQKREIQHESRDLTTRDFGFGGGDLCVEASEASHQDLLKRGSAPKTRGLVTRALQNQTTPGYTTTDDFGTNGDDTIHTKIPYYSSPNDLQANASFPTNGSDPQAVDVIFLDFIASYVLPALNKASTGRNYSNADISNYLPPSFDTNAYLPAYAKVAPTWKFPATGSCPVGKGIGYTS